MTILEKYSYLLRFLLKVIQIDIHTIYKDIIKQLKLITIKGITSRIKKKAI